jgi:hypothetical protein
MGKIWSTELKNGPQSRTKAVQISAKNCEELRTMPSREAICKLQKTPECHGFFFAIKHLHGLMARFVAPQCSPYICRRNQRNRAFQFRKKNIG